MDYGYSAGIGKVLLCACGTNVVTGDPFVGFLSIQKRACLLQDTVRHCTCWVGPEEE